MILTDREIKISIERRLIKIEPPPKELAFSSTAVDLTLDAPIRAFKPDVAGIDIIIDPSKEGFNSDIILNSLTDLSTIPSDGYLCS